MVKLALNVDMDAWNVWIIMIVQVVEEIEVVKHVNAQMDTTNHMKWIVLNANLNAKLAMKIIFVFNAKEIDNRRLIVSAKRAIMMIIFMKIVSSA